MKIIDKLNEYIKKKNITIYSLAKQTNIRYELLRRSFAKERRRIKKMDYICERITNISELESIIEGCYIQAQLLQKESSQKENFQSLITNLEKARSFEFRIERRKISYK